MLNTQTAAKPYKVYGDYGYDSEQLLEEFKSNSDAMDFGKGYTRWGDLGGYGRIEVISFADDGEAIVHWKIAKDED